MIVEQDLRQQQERETAEQIKSLLADIGIQTQTLKSAIIHGSEMAAINRKDLYRINFKLSELAGKGTYSRRSHFLAELYQTFLGDLKQIIREFSAQLLTMQDSEVYLVHFYRSTDLYIRFLYWAEKMYQGLNNQYLNYRYRGKPTTVFIQGMRVYMVNFFNPNLKKIQSALHDMFRGLRTKRQFREVSEIKELINLLHLLGFETNCAITRDKARDTYQLVVVEEESELFYRNNFEQPLIQDIRKYYEGALEGLTQLTSIRAVNEIDHMLKLEEQIALYYYQQSTLLVVHNIQQQLVSEQIEKILNKPESGMVHLLQNRMYEDLYKIFQFFSQRFLLEQYPLFKKDTSFQRRRVTTLPEIEQHESTFMRQQLQMKELQSERLSQYLQDKGQTIIEKCIELYHKEQNYQTVASEFMHRIIEVLEESEVIVDKVYDKDQVIIVGRDTAFKNILNKENKTNYFIAAFCDQLLQESTPLAESMLGYLSKIHGYLYNRDIFMKHYQKFLSSRILNRKSDDFTSEFSIINAFQSQASQSQLNQIKTMLKDISFSLEFAASYREQAQGLGLDLEVRILTQSAWPIKIDQKSVEIDLPLQIIGLQKLFTDIYNQSFLQRKLFWYYAGTNGILQMNISPEKSFQLQLHFYQIVILLKMQETKQEKVASQQLMARLGISPENFEHNLKPLLKMKILNEETVEGERYLCINRNFASSMKMIKLPGGEKLAIKLAENEVEKQIKLERKNIMDAYIVKLLKGSKVLSDQEIFEKVLESIDLFKPTFQDVKKRLEDLIKRDYLMRDFNNTSKYLYKL